MTDAMDERRRGFESKWAHDAELRFQVEARRNRALAVGGGAKRPVRQCGGGFLKADAVIAANFQGAGR